MVVVVVGRWGWALKEENEMEKGGMGRVGGFSGRSEVT